MDYNLLTGVYIESKADDNGTMISYEGKKDKKELLKLADFTAILGEEQLRFDE